MIRLLPNDLNQTEQDALNDLQAKINAEATFANKASKAQSLWNNKGGKAGKDTFEIIKDTLYSMCVFTGLCNYCEQSEANDVEHIYPKSFFPAFTFDWNNYILACKQCNSGYKLDKCFVLDDQDELVELVRGQEPPFTRVAFINIRTENPESFMLLNPYTHKFEIFPYISKRDQKKAEGTLKTLELNERDTLRAARRSAAIHYYEMLDRLGRLLSASTADELENLLNPHDNRFNLNKPLKELKTDIKESFKKYIISYQHPSVWQMIKVVQSKTDPKWKAMFDRIPDAINW